jgi:hypothetical protein
LFCVSWVIDFASRFCVGLTLRVYTEAIDEATRGPAFNRRASQPSRVERLARQDEFLVDKHLGFRCGTEAIRQSSCGR